MHGNKYGIFVLKMFDFNFRFNPMIEEVHKLHHLEHHQFQHERHRWHEINSGKFHQFNAMNLMMAFSTHSLGQLEENKAIQRLPVRFNTNNLIYVFSKFRN